MAKPDLRYEWLWPSAPDASAGARSTRDWLVDAACFVIGFGFTLAATLDLLRPEPVLVPEWRGADAWLVWLDFAISAIAACGLWWRRTRWLVPLAVFCAVAGLVTVAGAATGTIVLLTLAVHRRFRLVAVFAAVSVGTDAVFLLMRPEHGRTYVESLSWNTLILVVICVWGMTIRSRRQSFHAVRDRAERAEAEQQLRVARARSRERTRVAREMHDVLAHRIALLSVHAEGLEVGGDGAPHEVATAAGVIRANAHLALEDLRDIIDVLRDDRTEAPPPASAGVPHSSAGVLTGAAGARRGPAAELFGSAAELFGSAGVRVGSAGGSSGWAGVPPGSTGATGAPPRSAGGPAGRIQPTLGALPALADESRSAGVKVSLDVGIQPTAVPDGTGRTAYRIVQEGLTNARKHAPGTSVRVAVRGAAGDGLTVDIRNSWPLSGRASTIPGAGTGLIGLAERTTLAGGRLTHGRTPEDEFALTAWLPWPP